MSTSPHSRWANNGKEYIEWQTLDICAWVAAKKTSLSLCLIYLICLITSVFTLQKATQDEEYVVLRL